MVRDFESKVNYVYWNRTNVSRKIDNSRERMVEDYWDFSDFGI
jgi:hypothetical protein